MFNINFELIIKTYTNEICRIIKIAYSSTPYLRVTDILERFKITSWNL